MERGGSPSPTAAVAEGRESWGRANVLLGKTIVGQCSDGGGIYDIDA